MVIVTCGAGIGEPEVVVVAVATVVVAVTVAVMPSGEGTFGEVAADDAGDEVS